MKYPTIQHEKWRSVKYTDKQIAEMKSLYNGGMSKSDIARKMSGSSDRKIFSRYYQAVVRYCEPETIREQHKRRWQREKNNPEYLADMKERGRKNEYFNKHKYPEKMKYNREFIKEWSKTDQGKQIREKHEKIKVERIKNDPDYRKHRLEVRKAWLEKQKKLKVRPRD